MLGISRLVRSATLYGVAELLHDLGHDARPLLRQQGLRLADLQQPDHPIPVDAACQLLEASALATGHSDFGLLLASRRRLANLGSVSVVLREEPTGLQALHSLCRYLQLVNPCLNTQWQEAGEVVVIEEQLLTDTAVPQRQAVEMAVGVMHGILRELLGSPWRAQRICFTHRAATDSSFAKRLFACPIDYNAAFNGIVCARAPLEAQLPGRDAALARFTQRALERSLVQAPQSSSHTVRQLVMALLAQGRCSATQVASTLRMDRRSLSRHLQREGESFGSILQAVRKELVMRQLQDSDRSISDIAHLLGFGSLSAFAHWYRSEYGCSVSQWRQAHQTGDQPSRLAMAGSAAEAQNLDL